MSSITLDQATIDKLKTSIAPVQILDPQGKVVGAFRPAPRALRKGEIPDFSEDELRRAFNEFLE